jgi:hypothetical protein
LRQQQQQQQQLGPVRLILRQVELRLILGQQQQQPLPRQPQANHDDIAPVAALRAIRVPPDASIARLVGGALAMPMIARLMGDTLLRISHVVPLVRTIIAPRPPLPPAAAPIEGLVGLWGRARSAFRLFGGAGTADVAVVAAGGYDGWLGSFGNRVLGGFLVTTHEWAMSDPVWYDVFFRLLFYFYVLLVHRLTNELLKLLKH